MEFLGADCGISLGTMQALYFRGAEFSWISRISLGPQKLSPPIIFGNCLLTYDLRCSVQCVESCGHISYPHYCSDVHNVIPSSKGSYKILCQGTLIPFHLKNVHIIVYKLILAALMDPPNTHTHFYETDVLYQCQIYLVAVLVFLIPCHRTE